MATDMTHIHLPMQGFMCSLSSQHNVFTLRKTRIIMRLSVALLHAVHHNCSTQQVLACCRGDHHSLLPTSRCSFSSELRGQGKHVTTTQRQHKTHGQHKHNHGTSRRADSKGSWEPAPPRVARPTTTTHGQTLALDTRGLRNPATARESEPTTQHAQDTTTAAKAATRQAKHTITHGAKQHTTSRSQLPANRAIAT